MDIITLEAKKKQEAVKFVLRKVKSEARRKYNINLSSIKR